MLKLLDHHPLPILKLTQLVNVGRRSKPFDDLASLVPDGNGPGLEPAVAIVAVTDAVIDFQLATFDGMAPCLAGRIAVIGVEWLQPSPAVTVGTLCKILDSPNTMTWESRSMCKQAGVSLQNILGAMALIVSLAVRPSLAHAIASVSTPPATDVYAVLAQNPGLQASLPFYNLAQDANRFTSLTVIGVSYGDQGNALNIVDALQYHYAIATANLTNYAFGGATTGSVNNNPPALMLPGFSQQLDALVASGRRFSASDLITFTTAGVGGGNDTPLGISVAQGTANVVGYIQTLIALGARNIVLNAPTTAALQAALTPFASQGVNIYLFDQGALVTRILANPTAYGFAANATSLDYCSRLGGPNVCNEGSINKARLQTTSEILAEDKYLYFLAHPTTAMAAQIAAGDASLIASGTTLPEPGTMALLTSGLIAIAGMAAIRRRV